MELNYLVNFLYNGEAHFEKEIDCYILQSNLNRIFGFPENLCMKIENETLGIGKIFTWNTEFDVIDLDDIVIEKEEIEGEPEMLKQIMLVKMALQG